MRTIGYSSPLLASVALGVIGLSAAMVCPAAPEATDAPRSPAFTPKLMAPIDIDYAFDSEPAVGESLIVTFSIRAGEALGNATLSVRADDALTILAPQTAVELGSLAAGDTIASEATVLPLEAETLYLRVSVTGEIRGQRQSRSIAVPIRLEPAAPRKAEAQTTGKSEQTVRSFPAVETVR